jgi:hypothetical protein
MDDYIKQLEEQIEDLQDKLAIYEPYWQKGGNPSQMFFFFGRCLLAQYYFSKKYEPSESSESHDPDEEIADEPDQWRGIVYSTLGSMDLSEGCNRKTEEEIKAWILERVFSTKKPWKEGTWT